MEGRERGEGEADKCVVQSEHRTVALQCPRQTFCFVMTDLPFPFESKEKPEEG